MHYLFCCPLGLAVVDLSQPTGARTVQWRRFDGSYQEKADQYFQITSKNDHTLVREWLPTVATEVMVDARPLWEALRDLPKVTVEYQLPSQTLLTETYALLTEEEKGQVDMVGRHVANLMVQNQKTARDVFIAQAIASIDDMDKTINLVANRLREWYGVHFPELGEYIKETPQYFRLIEEIGDRESQWVAPDLSEKKEKRVREMSSVSLGVAAMITDLAPIQDLARLGTKLVTTRKEVEEYVENAVMLVMPNVTRLVGPLIAARLLAYAGSLEQLAKFPSSTIQLLGAERALFRHLQSGDRPPKHGIIFQSPYIHQAPFHNRGRIARVMAGKLTIAARQDFFLGEDQGDSLENDLKKRLQYIADKHAKPPTRKKTRPPKKPRDDRRPSRDRKGDRGKYKGKPGGDRDRGKFSGKPRGDRKGGKPRGDRDKYKGKPRDNQGKKDRTDRPRRN